MRKIDTIEETANEVIYDAVSEQFLIQSGFNTLIILLGIVLIRSILVRLVKGKKSFLDKEQRRWINRINNSTILFIFISLIFVWAPQLHTFALSLTAVAVAIVLSIKELLMCFTGGILHAATKPFDVGDWIKIDGITGEVMSINTLSTKIEEVETTHKTYQFTGRSIQIPNSKFLSINAENANFIKDYVYHNATITIEQTANLNIKQLLDKLYNITEFYFAPFREGATSFNKKIEKKSSLDFPDPEPFFLIETTESGDLVFVIRLFLPSREAAKVSSEITKDFLNFLFDSAR